MRNVRPEIPSGELHPCVRLLSEAWPIIDQILNSFGNLIPVSEAFARLIRACIASFGKSFAPLLGIVAVKIVPLFEETRLSAYLWITRKLVSEFIGVQEFTDPLYQLVERMTRATFLEFSSKPIHTIPDGNQLF